MIRRTIMRTGGHYRLVKYVSRSAASGTSEAAIFQIEDTAGQLICHCGSSSLEASQLFEALEHPVRRRLPQPAA
jgi:hypothetical protein